MLTDGGDSVRALAGVMAPGAAPILDWFHIAMRLTGLGQYTKGLAHHNPVEATALESRLERIKWRLWHGDAGEALTRAEQLAADVAALDSGYPKLKRLVKATANLATYIANNAAALPDYSERWLTGERISTAFVKSTVNLVVSRALPRNSRCSGPSRVPTCSCRPEPKPSTARCAICSPDGIRLWPPMKTWVHFPPLQPDQLPCFDMLPGRAGSTTEPTQRDGHIQSLADRGRLGWQRETDYGKRSKAETAMSRYKRILGDHLHARKLPGQQAEAAIGVAVLNRMIDTGRPDSVRVA